MKQAVSDGLICVLHIPTDENISDIFTKALTGKDYIQDRINLQIVPSSY